MTDTPPRRPRRRLRTALALAAGALLLVAAVTLVYASTPRGLQTLWIPLAERVLGAEIVVRAGRLALPAGRLELRGLSLVAETFEVDAAHAALDLDLTSLPPWRRPRVEALRLEVANVRLRPGPPEEEPPEEPGEGLPPALRPVPVRIDHASLRQVVVASFGEAGAAEGAVSRAQAQEASESSDEHPLQWRVEIARAEVQDLTPGRTGHLTLAAAWWLPSLGEPDLRSGAATLEVDLREPTSRRADPASADLTLRMEASSAPEEGAPPVLRLAARGHGVLRPDGSVDLREAELDAHDGEARLATLRAEGVWHPAAGRADLVLEAEAAPLAPLLTRAALAPRLAEPLAPADASLRARLRLGETSAIEASGAVWGLVPTPGAPDDVALAADVRLLEEAVALEEILLRGLDAGGGDAGSLRAEGRVGLEDAPRAELDLRSDGLPLLPWALRFGVALPRGLAPLGLDADLRVEGTAQAIDLAGSARLRLAAGSGEEPALAEDVELHLDMLRVSAEPEAGRVAAAVEARGPGRGAREEGSLRAEVELARAEVRPRLALRAELEGLDLAFVDALRTPAAGAASSAQEAEPEAPEARASAERVRGFAFALPVDLEAELDLAALDYRGLRVDRSHVTARAAGEDLALRVEGEGVAEGRIDLDYRRALDGDAVEAEWTVDLAGVDLVPILRAFTGEAQRLGGVLGIASEGRGRAPVAEAGLVAAGDGVLRFEIREGRAEGTRLQQVVAREAGISDFLTLRVAQASGELPIEGGSLLFQGVQVDGNLVHFRIDGSLSPSTVDLRVNPRIGPDLAAGHGLQNVLFAPVSSLVALPFVVTVVGALGDPAIGVRPATPAILGDVVGVAAGALQGMAGGAASLLGGGSEEAPEASETTPPVAAPPEGEATEAPAARSPAP